MEGNGAGLRGKSTEQTARRKQPGESRMYASQRFEERRDEQGVRREARMYAPWRFQMEGEFEVCGFRRWREPTWRPLSRPF